MTHRVTSSHCLRQLNSVLFTCFFACILLAGCSAIPTDSNKNWSEFSKKVDAHGALPVMHHEFDQLPFVEMLEGVETKDDARCLIKNGVDFDPISYQCATKKFYDRTRPLPDTMQRLERNRIQERILAISEDRCNAYKRYLRYDQSMSNFWLGLGSTLAGGLGAISNTLSSSKTFSAFGGVLSGINAEYNQAFYGNLFYSVIAKSIDEQRRDAYRQIQTYGQSKSLTEYPVEAAIKDAIVYDGTCSAVSAMEYAEKAVQLVNDPGMDSMMRYLVKANQSRYILQNGIKDIEELKQAGITTVFENTRFGSLVNTTDQSDPQAIIQMQLYMANQQTARDIVETSAKRYITNDDKKQKIWDDQTDKAIFTNAVEQQLKNVIDGLNNTLSQCTDPAARLRTAYTETQAQLKRASNDEKMAAQIKLDSARSEMAKINVELSSTALHFQSLLNGLTSAVLKSVSDILDGKSNALSLSWDYTKLPDNIKFPSTGCASFKSQAQQEPGSTSRGQNGQTLPKELAP